MEVISKTFCPLPWIHLCTNPTGRICLCCEDTLNSDFSGRRDYHISSGLDEFRNSEYLNWVRERMMNGQDLRECLVCYEEEKRNLQSKRLFEIQQWGELHGEQEIIYADLKLGNRCNLQCLMCDPISSSKMAAEFKELGWDKNPPFAVGQMGIPVKDAYCQDWKWPEDENLWKTITGLTYSLKKVKFTGGEPLLNPFVINYLEILGKLNKPDLKIQLTTNGTVVNSRILSLLSNLNIDVIVSLEGVGPVNDFIRYPSQWESIIENIKQVMASNDRIRINCTISILNMLYITDIIEFNHQLFDKRLTIMPVILPKILNPEIAPESLKKAAINRLESWLSKTNVPFADYYYKQVAGRILFSESNPVLFEESKSYILKICKHRTIEIQNYLPELAKIMN